MSILKLENYSLAVLSEWKNSIKGISRCTAYKREKINVLKNALEQGKFVNGIKCH